MIAGSGSVITHVMLQMNSDPHYLAIRDFYEDKRAERSGVPYMNHINEGLLILDAINSSVHAKQAFCIHPIFQDDSAFATAFSPDSVIQRYEVDGYAIALAVEYRAIANAYLSHHSVKGIDGLKLSPLADIQDMLIADKIQNRKDFLIHHADSHPRARELSLYFQNWLTRLGVSEHRFRELSSVIGT